MPAVPSCSPVSPCPLWLSLSTKSTTAALALVAAEHLAAKVRLKQILGGTAEPSAMPESSQCCCFPSELFVLVESLQHHSNTEILLPREQNQKDEQHNTQCMGQRSLAVG